MSAAVSSKAGQRPRSATVGDYQQQKTDSDIPPVPPLPPLHKKVGNVAAVQLDDLELDDDHMAAITAVVNNSSRDEPPEHLFLNVPGSNEPGSRLSVASKRASTISTRSTNSVNQSQTPATKPGSTPDSTLNGRQSRRSSLRNSLLVVKDLPDLPSGSSGRPITPTRARAAPPSSYAPPPESIAQRLEAAHVTPEPTLSAPVSPAQSAPSTPTRPRAEFDAAAPAPRAGEPVDNSAKAASAALTLAPAPATTTEPSTVKVTEQPTVDAEKPVEVEEPVPVQPIAAEEPAPEPTETPQPTTIDEKKAIAPQDEPAPALDITTPAAANEQSPAAPESDLDPSEVPEIPDDDAPAAAMEDAPAGPTLAAAVESVEPSVDSTETAEQPSVAISSPAAYATPPRSPANGEVAKSEGPIVQTPDEEVPGQSWSSSSHADTPSMLPRTPVGDELSKVPTIAGDESPLLTPQRTGSPVAVKQRQVSAPLIKEPEQEKGEKAYVTPQASPIGKGTPPVSQRYSQLRSVSLPAPGTQRRLSSPPKSPKSGAEDPSLDDFVGLMKQVISREKGMSIRDAARAAEQRKSSVPV